MLVPQYYHPKTPKIMVLLDIETSGIKSMITTKKYESLLDFCADTGVNLVQYKVLDYKTKEVLQYTVMFRPSKDHKNKEILLKLLQNDEVVFVGYNILNFDLYRLYHLYKPTYRFQAQFFDLFLSIKRSQPFSKIMGGKSILAFRKIAEPLQNKLEKFFKDFLEDEIDKIIRNPKYPNSKNIYEVKKSRKFRDKCKLSGFDFHDILFYFRFNLKLKNLVVNLGLVPEEEILKIADTWNIAEFKEDLKYPHLDKDEIKPYLDLYKKNEELLDCPVKSKDFLKYAENDIKYVELLYKYLEDLGNDLLVNQHHICGHINTYQRYIGIPLDIEKAKEEHRKLDKKLKEIIAKTPFNINSFPMKKNYILDNLSDPDDYEDLEPTLKTHRKALKKIIEDDICTPEATEILKRIVDAGVLKQRIKLLERMLKHAEYKGRIHFVLNPDKTITGRMAGRNGLSIHSIPSGSILRSCIGGGVTGGDFKTQEKGILADYTQDTNLKKVIEDGIDSHLLLGVFFEIFPSYEEAVKLKEAGDKEVIEARKILKGINFARDYGQSDEIYFKSFLCFGITEDEAKRLYEKNYEPFYKSLSDTKKTLEKSIVTATSYDKKDFKCIGKMLDGLKDMFGQTRYMELEKALCTYIWKNVPGITEKIINGSGFTCIDHNYSKFADHFQNEKKENIVQVKRYDTVQTLDRALSTSIIGSVHKIQNDLFRQCNNFVIQSTAALSTKILMCYLWEKCPEVGILCIHDEVLIWGENLKEKDDKLCKEIEGAKDKFLEDYKEYIPSLNLDWDFGKTWLDIH